MEESESIWKEYTKLNLLGNSANGKAYKAKSKENNKIVVIKQYSKEQKNSTALYKNEIKYMEELKSENTIKYIKLEESLHFNYIIREFYYATLDEFTKVNQNGVSVKDIQKILLDLSIPFKILNQKNLIHRDIKPSNILFTYDEKKNIKAILSGIYLTQKKEENLNNNLGVNPIRLICAPEVLEGEELDMKSDIWSVGILIYFLIKGNYPFNGNRDKVILREIEKGIDLNISDDNDLNDLLNKTLEKDIKKRISWNEFFNHQFLKKKFNETNKPSKEKKDEQKIKKGKEEILKIKNEINNLKKTNINTIRDYSLLIKIIGKDKDLHKKFEDEIYKPIQQAYMNLIQILSSKKFN